MREIELSIMDHGQDFIAELNALLEEFHAQSGYLVRLRILPWKSAWAELVKVALYGEGPVVSEIGSTWVSDFVGMNALKPFNGQEISRLGGSAQFIKTAWDSVSLTGVTDVVPNVWAIPWLSDTRLLYYRKDLLERAGVNPETGFKAIQELDQALSKIQRSSETFSPWVVPTSSSRMSIHNLASWIWGAGGDFVTPDHKHTLFTSPESKAGIYAYFELYHYMSQDAYKLDEIASDRLFWSGNAAMTISGPWLMKEKAISDDITRNVGKTLPPGIPYVGGSHLVVWRNGDIHGPAIDLIRFLVSQDAESRLFEKFGVLPTRLDVLSSSAFAQDPFYTRLAQGLLEGRSFYPFTLWGLLENKLTDAISAVWDEIMTVNKPDIRFIVDRHFDPLARRLNITLSS
ncbi:MAG: extracellular solute-binding protein [Chloroflexota bacterium]|nr:MAG: extracellular solute-binding protein [Chloroflexota bacterium]